MICGFNPFFFLPFFSPLLVSGMVFEIYDAMPVAEKGENEMLLKGWIYPLGILHFFVTQILT